MNELGRRYVAIVTCADYAARQVKVGRLLEESGCAHLALFCITDEYNP